MKKTLYKNTIVFLFTTFGLLIFINYLFAADDKAMPKDAPLRPQVEYKSEVLRDPFLSYLEKEKKQENIVVQQTAPVVIPPPSLTVQGIIWGGDISQAIINQKVVKIGDTIEGAKVTDINKDGIKMIFNDQELYLSSPATSKGKESKEEKLPNTPEAPGVVPGPPMIP